MASRQTTMPGVVPPLNIAQEAALSYLETKEEAKRATERANDRKDDMIKAAMKLGVDVIKVRNSKNTLFIFDLQNKVDIKQTKMTDVKIEKSETEALRK